MVEGGLIPETPEANSGLYHRALNEKQVCFLKLLSRCVYSKKLPWF